MSELRGGRLSQHPEQPKSPELSTPEQASALLYVIGSLTELKGTDLGKTKEFGEKVDVLPPSIAAHFPKPQSDSKGVDHSIYLIRKSDKDEDVAGIAAFEQHEHRDEDLTYVTHVNYHVIDDGEKYHLERHVANTERGSHMFGRDMDISPEQALNEVTELQTQAEEASASEKAIGLLTVDAQEAKDINTFLVEQLKAELTRPTE